jgi:hypothetical protein
MSVALGVLAAAAALAPLPPLPPQGLALETRAGVELETLAGRRITVVPRLNRHGQEERAASDDARR